MKRTFEFVLVLTVLAISTAAAQDRAAFPEHRGPYLALGDSDPFGYNQFLTNLAAAAYGLPPTIPLPDVLLSYSGYPQDVSELLKLDLTNASCPGQTSSGFLYYPPPVLEPDNGCDQWRAAGLPLFVTYASVSETQEGYATSFLAAHRDTRLVTITIGGDDLLVLQATCGGSESCVEAGLPGVLLRFTTNLTEIYTGIRSTGYDGPIVAVNYASPDYTKTGETETDAVSALNSAILSVTELFGGKVADVFSAFKLASGAEGLPCAVGLSFFTPPSGPGCDVHPTPLGQLVIGQLVLKTLGEDRFPVDFSQLRENY